jgi:hypothetical protein
MAGRVKEPELVLYSWQGSQQSRDSFNIVGMAHERTGTRFNCMAGLTKEPGVDHIRKPCPLYDFVSAAFVSPATAKRQTIKW